MAGRAARARLTGQRLLAFRFATELGYDVTMVKDATADYSEDHMHAALDLNMPNYASAIVTTNEVIESISSLKR